MKTRHLHSSHSAAASTHTPSGELSGTSANPQAAHTGLRRARSITEFSALPETPSKKPRQDSDAGSFQSQSRAPISDEMLAVSTSPAWNTLPPTIDIGSPLSGEDSLSSDLFPVDFREKMNALKKAGLRDEPLGLIKEIAQDMMQDHGHLNTDAVLETAIPEYKAIEANWALIHEHPFKQEDKKDAIDFSNNLFVCALNHFSTTEKDVEDPHHEDYQNAVARNLPFTNDIIYISKKYAKNMSRFDSDTAHTRTTSNILQALERTKVRADLSASMKKEGRNWIESIFNNRSPNAYNTLDTFAHKTDTAIDFVTRTNNKPAPDAVSYHRP